MICIFRFLAVASFLLLSGCALQPAAPVVPAFSPAAITGVEWIATVVDGVPYMQSPRPKLRWTSVDALSGTGGCNAFAARATLGAQNSVRIGSMVPIGKPCMTEPGAQEDMFFKALEQTAQARIESGQLLLLTDDGRVLLRMSKSASNP